MKIKVLLLLLIKKKIKCCLLTAMLIINKDRVSHFINHLLYQKIQIKEKKGNFYCCNIIPTDKAAGVYEIVLMI